MTAAKRLNRDEEVRLTALLQRAGLRVTRPRLALAALLFDGNHKHLSVEQISESLRKQKETVSLATIYNSLHQFTTAGLLREVTFDHDRTYFDTNIGPHHHFFDGESGVLTDIPSDAIEVSHLPPPPQGMEIAQVELVLRVKPCGK